MRSLLHTQPLCWLNIGRKRRVGEGRAGEGEEEKGRRKREMRSLPTTTVYGDEWEGGKRGVTEHKYKCRRRGDRKGRRKGEWRDIGGGCDLGMQCL